MQRSLSFLVVVLSLGLLPANADQPAPAVTTADQVNTRIARSGLDYYKDHLESCPQHEVRCLWFSRDHVGVGMVMTLNLRESRVDTVRDVYSHAKQNQKERELSHVQTTIVEELLPQLPPGSAATETEFAKGLHIAFWKAGKPCLVSYPRSAVPRLVQRLYDIGGGAPDFTYVEHTHVK